MISHVLLSQPTVEPITLEEIKAHCRVEHEQDDILISALITAARQWCEHYTRRAFINQTWDLAISTVPEKRYINLPRAPLSSVTAVQLFNERDELKTWSADQYYSDVIHTPGRVVLRDDATWPSQQRCSNGMVVTYVAGYGPDGSFVPEAIKLAIKQLVLHWYEYRGDAVHTTMTAHAPMTVEALLDPYRVMSLGGGCS